MSSKLGEITYKRVTIFNSVKYTVYLYDKDKTCRKKKG